MASYILGVDGGGTKTHCALFTRDGRAADFLEWGTTSHEFLPLGYESVRLEFQGIMQALERRNDLQWDDVQVVMGLAGADTKRQVNILTGIVKELGLEHVLVANDAFLGIKGATPEGWGICVCNGSGTGVSGIDPAGHTCSIGALFELTGDYAGGRILGAEVVRAVYDSCFRSGRATKMTRLLQKAVAAKNCDDMMERIVCGCADHTIESKQFAPILFEAAQAGDEIAQEILVTSGEHLARDVVAACHTLEFPCGESVPVVLLGSLFTKCTCNVQIDAMKRKLKQELPDMDLQYRKMTIPPVLGAVKWGMDILNLPVELETLEQQFTECVDRLP
jgi:N-acetylglucosamine kinase-like BadF-type ATPase